MPLIIHVFYENFEFLGKFGNFFNFEIVFLILKFYANFEFLLRMWKKN